MWYAGSRRSVPASRYGLELMVMEAMHWTLDEYLAQPDDLIDELTIRLTKRAQAEAKAQKQAESKTHGKRR